MSSEQDEKDRENGNAIFTVATKIALHACMIGLKRHNLDIKRGISFGLVAMVSAAVMTQQDASGDSDEALEFLLDRVRDIWGFYKLNRYATPINAPGGGDS